MTIWKESCILKRKKVYIEIPVFLVYFAFTFADSITNTFVKYRTCYLILNFQEKDCSLLEDNVTVRAISVLDRKVQPSAIVITSTISIIQSLIPPLLCFFIGPWCNVHGRKPIMLYSTFALIIQFTIMIFISAISHISPWYITLSQIMLCISGGIPAFVAVIFPYISDTVTEYDRGIRIALLEAVRSCGILLGMATGSIIFRLTSYVTVYSLTVITLLFAWIFIWLCVPESLQTSKTEVKLPKFFDFVSLLSTAKVIFKAREGYQRAFLLTTISMITVYIMAVTGTSSVLPIYFQNHFHWNLTSSYNYNIVIAATTIIGGMICVYVLHVKLKCDELIGVMTSFLSLLTGSLILAMANATSIIHLGGCMQCFGPALLSMAKSRISKLVPHEEMSTIFAVVAALETVFALVGASLFAVIYHSTAASTPSAFLFVITGLYLGQLIMVSFLVVIQRYWNPLPFSRIEEENY